MNDNHKKDFWLMINVAMELTNHPPLSKEAIIVWWNLLSKCDFDDVRKGMDAWLDSSKKAPTPSDILELCKPKVTIHARLPSPLSIESNKRHAGEVKAVVRQMAKPRADYRAWARKIIANPGNYPDISLRLAQEALKAPMVTS